MTGLTNGMLKDPRVAIARVSTDVCAEGQLRDSELATALGRAAQQLGWSAAGNPLGGCLRKGARVLIKPNFVMHRNERGGIDPLITDPSLVRVVTEAALGAGASFVLVGDAPVQGCDFYHLLTVTKLGDWSRRLIKNDARFAGVHDFRRTSCVFYDGVRIASENLKAEDRFVLFDLGR